MWKVEISAGVTFHPPLTLTFKDDEFNGAVLDTVLIPILLRCDGQTEPTIRIWHEEDF